MNGLFTSVTYFFYFQFDWFQTLIPNSSLEQGETAAFWKLCMSSEDVQATALWNLQEELDRPIKNNRYEHFKVKFSNLGSEVKFLSYQTSFAWQK